MRPIVATLILMVAGRGIAQLSEQRPDHYFSKIQPSHLWGEVMCRTFLIQLSVGGNRFLAMAALLRTTALGLFVEATGDNETASQFSGVNTRAIKCFAYLISGLFAALAGLIAASDIKGADANTAGFIWSWTRSLRSSLAALS